MSDIDNTFERLINTMALKYDRGVVRGKRKDHWFGGEPVSDEWFLEAMAEIAPVIIDKWWRYLDADGDLNLDEAMFGKGNHAERKAALMRTVTRDRFFSHLHTLQIVAERKGHPQPNITQRCRDFVESNPDLELGPLEDLPRKYRYWKSKQTVL